MVIPKGFVLGAEQHFEAFVSDVITYKDLTGSDFSSDTLSFFGTDKNCEGFYARLYYKSMCACWRYCPLALRVCTLSDSALSL